MIGRKDILAGSDSVLCLHCLITLLQQLDLSTCAGRTLRLLLNRIRINVAKHINRRALDLKGFGIKDSALPSHIPSNKDQRLRTRALRKTTPAFAHNSSKTHTDALPRRLHTRRRRPTRPHSPLPLRHHLTTHPPIQHPRQPRPPPKTPDSTLTTSRCGSSSKATWTACTNAKPHLKDDRRRTERIPSCCPHLPR